MATLAGFSAPSASLSLAKILIVTAEFSPVLCVSSAATGGVLTSSSATVMLTVAVSVPPLPSLIVYVNVSSPLKPSLGVYVKVPSALNTKLPLAGSVLPVMVSASPSGSLSLGNTLPETGVPNSVETASSSASGASFTGGGGGGGGTTTSSATVMLTVAVSVPPLPSLIVYVNVSSPLKPSLGVYVKVPSALNTKLPLAGSVLPVMVSASPSGSLSLGNTLPETGVPNSVETASSSASGASFTGGGGGGGGTTTSSATVMLTVAVSVPPLPSEIV